MTKMTYFNQRASERSTSQAIVPYDEFTQTSPDAYFPQVVRNGALVGVVSAISLRSSSFTATGTQAYYKALLWWRSWQKDLVR